MQHNSTIYATMRPASGGKSLVTLSTYEERQEALKRTTMMEDDVNHRASRNITAESMNKNVNGKLSNGNQSAQITKQEQQNIQIHQQQQQQQQLLIPPPPPQFANSPPKNSQTAQSNATYKVTQKSSSSNATKQYAASKPPSSPTPDYDNVQMRATSSVSRTTQPSANYANSNIFITNGRESSNASANNRRTTMRLGTVTIGEYEHEHQRKEPGKFDFISAQKRSQQYQQQQQQIQYNEEPQTLRSELQNTLSKSNLKKTNSGQQRIEHQSNCPLQNGYDNNNAGGVESITRKLQSAVRVSSKIENPTNGVASASASSAASTASGSARSSLSNGSVTGGGILKNGNRNSNNGGTFSKSSEKTITFGN